LGAEVGALLDKTPLQPPLAVVEAINAVYAASTVAWLEQAATVTSVPQLNTTVGAAVTVNVELFTTSASQLLDAVHVTVTEPPQAEGAAPASLVTLRLQPPLELAVNSHAAYLLSIEA